MSVSFIHLRLHTEYSLSDGIIRIEDLITELRKQKSPAVAITDKTNFFAAVKFYQAAIAGGIKPILGADCWCENSQNPKYPFRFTLLCQDFQGYRNLTRLMTRAYQEGQGTGTPLIQKNWLAENNGGLICLSGAQEGEIGQTLLMDKTPAAIELLNEWKSIFAGRFYLEIHRTGRQQEELYIEKVVDLAHHHAVPLVATNDVRFLYAEDFEAHEARVCISEGYTLSDPRRPHSYSPEQYLRSPEEMEKLFADLPEALTNTVEIAKRCNLELSLGKTSLPNFPIPENLTIEQYLKKQAQEGLELRLASLNPADPLIYHDRLKVELDVINSMGFAGYFLIVADFIRWAKEQQIPVGPGRGSGAGSLVAYSLQITDLDPLQYDLLFERFLNPERISMPDFDIDFCMDGRDRVIDYVADRYGRNAVSQIITYGSMAARAVVRDVGRVLGYPYGMVDKIAKLIPFEIGITLEKALKQEEELAQRYKNEDEIKVLFDLALKLEGLSRNVGKHAAGVVIAPSCLTDFTPLYCEADGSNLVTQFDMDDIQTVGLVKFDFLGLRTLTIIDWAVQTINKKNKLLNKPLIDISKIDLCDSATFTLLKDCATTAVFQLESRGMKDLVKRLKPDSFEDIIALVALFRPGPLQSGMVDDFINRKHGQAKVDYFHFLLEPILRPTYGIILYQEQVMQIAQVLAGYSLGAADLLRRAMGKKKAEEMAKQRAIFVAGAKAQDVSEDLATTIFDLMEKFADYGFNKSHSAAYALVSYQTAWLKTHYPAEFMAAVLSSDMDHTDKVVAFLDECRRQKLEVLPPDINSSQYKFTVDDNGKIIYGLGAIKGVGESAVQTIIQNRQQSPFKNIFDLCERVDGSKVNRRTYEALIKSGSLDSLGLNRASLLFNLDLALQFAEQRSASIQGGQQDLFGSMSRETHPNPVIKDDWKMNDRLNSEKESLGFYLTGHPLQQYQEELGSLVTCKLADVQHLEAKSVIVAGWVVNIKILFTKKGDRMAILTLEDKTGRLELPVFSEALNLNKEIINKDKILMVEGDLSVDEFTGNKRVLPRKLFDIQQWRETYGKALILKFIQTNLTPNDIEKLKGILLPHRPGRFPVFIEYQREESITQLYLGDGWTIKPTDEVVNNLRNDFGQDNIVVRYS